MLNRVFTTAYRKPYVPPTSKNPLIVRSLDYGGEPHPAMKKRVIVVAVDQLPLRDEAAIHKLKVLAGTRWTPSPPANSGVSRLEHWGNGYIQISCEDFPKPAMNLKWASDALDRLIAEANVRSLHGSPTVISLMATRTSNAGPDRRFERYTPRYASRTCQSTKGQKGRASSRSHPRPAFNI